MHEGLWTLSGVVIILSLLVWFLHRQSLQSSTKFEELDLAHYQTLLQQDIPRNSFVLLYEGRFPFDTTDTQYQVIKQLEHKYSQSVREFLIEWNVEQTAIHHQKIIGHVDELTDLLRSIYDLLEQYVPIESDDMDTFQECTEEMYDWFDEIRRVHQAHLRQMI